MEKASPEMGEPNESKIVSAPRSKDRGRMRKRLARFLTGAGLLLLLYVCSQYLQMYASQRSLALEWQHQNARPENVVAGNTDALIRLTIPHINLDAVVVEGASRKSLKLGPGHMQNSAVPGSSGNAVIVAHRDTFFRHLDDLKEGDEIDLQRRGEVFRFAVTGRRVVEPTDLSALQSSTSAELTLITCYPMHYVGPAPKRLVVVARLVATGKDSGQQNSEVAQRTHRGLDVR
jgi:LPXTG-site transpeptidase (sortase) family protein